MSNKSKKRKISMEPVLQDFTVTSFSDLHPDVPGPSDSSLFEEMKNIDVELSEITLNQTSDVNILSGPYPSDSSLDSFIKQHTNSKTNSKDQRPFQKRSKKKLVEDNLFDSCLKDSFSNHSLEKVQKPFQRKQKNKVRLSIFDSDLEGNTSIKESPFKKPFQRKSKNTQQSNLFDSLLKDSLPNTPDPQHPRPFQMKSKKKISSNYFDEVFSNDSINQPSPDQNFITRRKNRMKRPNDSNLFDEDLGSSQSDVSMALQPLGLKPKTASNNIKDYTGIFDDVLDATGNESQDEKSLVLDSYSKNNYFNEDNSQSFNLEYNEEPGGRAKGDDSSKNEETREPETENERTDPLEENQKENKCLAKLPDQQNMSTGDGCLKLQEHVDKDKSIVQSPNEKDLPEDEEAEEQNGGKCESPNQQGPLQHRSANLEYERNKELEGIEGEIDYTAELPETMAIETEDEELIKLETEDEETIQFETEYEETRQFEAEDEGTIQFETEYEETRQFEAEDEETIQFETEDNEKAKEIKNCIKTQCFTDSLCQFSSYIKNSKNINRALESEDSIKDGDTSEAKEASECSDRVARELNEVDSIHIHAISLESRSSLPCTREVFQTLSLPKLYPDFELPLMKLNDKEMCICSPEESFKCMPSSTPIVKGKRVSFLLKEETCLKGSRENNVTNNSTSTRRKSSLRSHKESNDSGNVNNLTKDNSMHLRKRRVSFKMDNRKNNSLTQSNVENSDKLEQIIGNQSNNNYSSVSFESLVYVEPSGSRTPDSESVYINIHPSRGGSTSSSNTESIFQAKSKSFKTSDSCARDSERCEYDESNVNKENGLSIEEGHENNNLDNNNVEEKQNFEEEKTIENTNSEGKCSISENISKGNEGEESDVEAEESDVEEEESDVEAEESDVEAEESDVEAEESYLEEEESDVEEEVEEESGREEEVEQESDLGEKVEEEKELEEEKVQNVTAEEQLVSEQESEEQDLVAEGQETERHSYERAGNEEFLVNNDVISCEQDENINPNIKMAGDFKLPFSKKVRGSSLFREKLLEVPSKSQLRDIMNKIPVSEFKKRNKRKLSEHCISKEQMQQYEIEEELMKNRKNKTQHKGIFSASSKLKRPKKWVSPRLYNFLIDKLKPQYGIRSRVRAEELVFSLVEHVECIKKKNELMREDVEKIKIELATLGIVKTHWDFYKFVDQYLEYDFKEKLYPSLPGVGRSAFEFGPSNVLENILESVQQ